MERLCQRDIIPLANEVGLFLKQKNLTQASYVRFFIFYKASTGLCVSVSFEQRLLQRNLT